jgi:hypothetical protein
MTARFAVRVEAAACELSEDRSGAPSYKFRRRRGKIDEGNRFRTVPYTCDRTRPSNFRRLLPESPCLP